VHQLRSLLGARGVCHQHRRERYTLNGALMHWSPVRSLWSATDGHRLAFAKVAESVEGVTTSVEYLIALKGVSPALRTACHYQGDFVTSFPANLRCSSASARASIPCGKMMGKFPDYRAVMPKTNDQKAIVAVRI